MSRRWRCQRLAISAPWASPAAASAAALQGHIAPASTLRSAGIRHRPDTRYGASGTLAMQPGAVELARGPAGVTSISPFGSMWQALGGYFQDPRLRQLFGRYATYCGSSPFLAPATLMLVAHVEQDGVWLLDGGMHTLATTLQQLALARGASFRYGAAVHSIVTRDGRACGVRLAHGEQLDAAAVVFNGDAGSGFSGNQQPGGQHSLTPRGGFCLRVSIVLPLFFPTGLHKHHDRNCEALTAQAPQLPNCARFSLTTASSTAQSSDLPPSAS